MGGTSLRVGITFLPDAKHGEGKGGAKEKSQGLITKFKK
jgi:hypothetical protein